MHRGHTAESQAVGIDAGRAQRGDALITDVEREQAAPAGVDGEAEPGGARLLGVHTHAGGCRTLQRLLGRGEELEELVRGDDDVDRTIGRWQPIIDELDLPPAQCRGLGDPSGDLRHEPVAALGDEDVDRRHASY